MEGEKAVVIPPFEKTKSYKQSKPPLLATLALAKLFFTGTLGVTTLLWSQQAPPLK